MFPESCEIALRHGRTCHTLSCAARLECRYAPSVTNSILRLPRRRAPFSVTTMESPNSAGVGVPLTGTLGFRSKTMPGLKHEIVAAFHSAGAAARQIGQTAGMDQDAAGPGDAARLQFLAAVVAELLDAFSGSDPVHEFVKQVETVLPGRSPVRRRGRAEQHGVVHLGAVAENRPRALLPENLSRAKYIVQRKAEARVARSLRADAQAARGVRRRPAPWRYTF